ncbi:MAG TPA: transglycosylase, partial [Gammaproteobacteria bacterium]|nr:transglycosylase [Gammaproteobacteria bacterium]
MLVIVAALLASCTAKQPSNIDNICDIFSEQRSWYKAANKS